MKTRKILIVISTLLMLWVIGYVVPAVLIRDGTEKYVGVEKKYAENAIEDAKLALSSPSLYRLYTTKLQVVDLVATSDEQCPYEAVVQGHTYFGIAHASMKWNVKPGCSFEPSD